MSFDYNHIQRSALLLLPVGGVNTLYVAFAPGDGESENGWMFGYSFNSGVFSQTAIFSSTPFGTGGGIWQSGAGPASDGNYIYAATGNGTFSYVTPGPPSTLEVLNYGDSLLKLNPTNLTVFDYYTPSDVFTYNGTGRCTPPNDEDFGSGGVLLPFSDFTYNTMNVVINADKESNLYVANTTGLGGFNASGGNNVQTITTPPKPQNDPTQGYWASPAYWKYTSGSTINYMLYHSATMQSTAAGVAPEAINGYKLLTSGPSGPIPTTYASTNILFCDYSPTPSVSSSGTAATTGIVWAIEHQNQDNPSVPDCNGNYIPHCGAARIQRNQYGEALQQQECDHGHRASHNLLDSHDFQRPGVYGYANGSRCIRAV